jgi:manganese/zinc/iron transport system permease protein
MLSSISSEDLWIIYCCTCATIACALPGVFLMLRRMSMLGDAVSHAVLPGIAASFLITGSRAILPMLSGALIAGILASFLATYLTRRKLATPDAALGIVFTSFFALGVVIISWGAKHVDLDLGCVLYGLAEFIPLDTVGIFNYNIPRAVVILTSVLIINTLLVILFYKELILTSFDPVLAHCTGIPNRKIQYGLMAVTAATAVATFESVGSVLVVAMFVIPPASAYLLADRVTSIILIAGLLGVGCATGGYLGALHYNSSVAGMMSVIAGCFFVIAAVLSPRHGLIRKIIHRSRLKVRIVRDDLLGMVFRWHEINSQQPKAPLKIRDAFRAFGRSPLTALALLDLRRRGFLKRGHEGSILLTELGMVEGRALIRSHRLWETYLAKHLGLPLDHLHEPSERIEHYIGRALAREIEHDVGITNDPHGRDIPSDGSHKPSRLPE